MKEVFKPFVSTKPDGLGLGLGICRSIAAAHGGNLEFDRDYSRGARIVLSLPLRVSS
jgi:signal transduction histidine kinase